MVDNVIDPNIIPPTPQNAGGEKKFNKKIVLILFALIVLAFIGYLFVDNDLADKFTTNEPMDYPHRKVLVFGDYPKDINDKKPFKLTLTELDPNKPPIKTLTFDKPLKMYTNFDYDRALFGTEDKSEFWTIDIHGNQQSVKVSLTDKTSDIYFLNPQTLIYSECTPDCHLVKNNLETGETSTLASISGVQYKLAGLSQSKKFAYLLGARSAGKVFMKYDFSKNKVVKEVPIPATTDSIWLSPDLKNIAYISYDKSRVLVNLYNLSNNRNSQFLYNLDPLPYKVSKEGKLHWSADSNKILFIAESLKSNQKCCEKLKLALFSISNSTFTDVQDVGHSSPPLNWMDGVAWINDTLLQVAQYTANSAVEPNGSVSRNVKYDTSNNTKGDYLTNYGKIISEW